MEDMATFGTVNTELQNAKQSIVTERLMVGSTKSLRIQDFLCLLKHFLEKAWKNDLSWSGWEKSGVYHFERATVWRVLKVDIKAFSAALALAKPLTFPTKFSALLIEMNVSYVDTFTTALETELARKRKFAEANSDA